MNKEASIPATPVAGRRYDGKTVLVTGGGKGIGLAATTRFASEGARVIVFDHRIESATSGSDAARKAGAPDAYGAAVDIGDEAAVVSALAQAAQQFGVPNVLVNNAGAMDFKPLIDLTVEDWMKILRVDLLGAFVLIREAFRMMKSGGAIINVASIHAIETTPDVAPYAAAKAAMLSLTRSAAIEGRSLGIRVNAVLPGAIDTPMLWENPNVKSGKEKIDRSDVGQATDVADVIAFLGSDDARFVNGASIVVDGGRLARL
jgi:NAD(P)-dependent dehydrogenase (short-subunit alcohol dehydrogenase family)